MYSRTRLCRTHWQHLHHLLSARDDRSIAGVGFIASSAKCLQPVPPFRCTHRCAHLHPLRAQYWWQPLPIARRGYRLHAAFMPSSRSQLPVTGWMRSIGGLRSKCDERSLRPRPKPRPAAHRDHTVTIHGVRSTLQFLPSPHTLPSSHRAMTPPR
ncbi:hypothetical protein B0H12DRAFT_171898 [Mycena haematopus]|nr:hypothetical protein B0H12DRAFT_171898 [Mycena haematopus]